jgi:hypothetical protein
MSKLQPYKPTDEDLDWARRIIQLGQNQCIIGTTYGDYVLDRNAKTLTLRAPALDNSPDTLYWHYCHTYTWKELGIQVLPIVDWEAIELPEGDTLPDFMANPESMNTE